MRRKYSKGDIIAYDYFSKTYIVGDFIFQGRAAAFSDASFVTLLDLPASAARQSSRVAGVAGKGSAIIGQMLIPNFNPAKPMKAYPSRYRYRYACSTRSYYYI